MKHLLLVLTTITLTLFLSTSSLALEILRWERLPLVLPLVVGHERVVFIDRNIRVGVPDSLGDRLRVQSAGGALYLRASEPIESTRLQLQDIDTGAFILLDIFAEIGEEPLEPVRIIESESPANRYGDAGEQTIGEPSLPVLPPMHETPIPVVLTRYAAQNLYAPLRTVEPVAGIVRTNLRRSLPLDMLLPTLPLRAKALAAWRLADLWVTAIRLTNTSTQGIALDPRALQGDFVTATFQHPDLGPAGNSSDTTVVYLVTRRDLAQSLLPVISPIDASLNLSTSTVVDDAGGDGNAE